MTVLVAGERFNFRAIDGVPSADAWRALDHAVARWVIAHGGGTMVAELAGWASYAEGQGDSALPVRGLGAGRHGAPSLGQAQWLALAANPMVGAPGAGSDASATTPFVLDGDNFYLRRSYLHEVAIAQLLGARRNAVTPPAQPLSDLDLVQLFQGQSSAIFDAQHDAVRAVLGRRLFVLTGGPGTGKTSTVLRMLMALSREHGRRHGAMPAIRISAPTGKAAARVSESLREGAAAFAADQRAARGDWTRELGSALAAESTTMHRLLGSRGQAGGFNHHAGNPLPADIVVVDEASMLDLTLLRALLEALPDDALLVLVGDADQLTSIGTGSVLLDLVLAMENTPAGDLVRLRHCFRADTALQPINEAIRQGDPSAFERAWTAASGERVKTMAVNAVADLARLLAGWTQALHASLVASGALAMVPSHDQVAIAGMLRELRGRQLLCALRDSEFGAQAANDAIEAGLRRRSGNGADETWYPGRAVMITRNDYSADLFNGDVGICLQHEDGSFRVWFEANATADPRHEAQTPATIVRDFAPGSLPEHQGAFAVTIHKSQGSEYRQVAVLLPPDPGNAVLSRQLLYTAVTRAREMVELWTSPETLSRTIVASVQRNAALRRRIEEFPIR